MREPVPGPSRSGSVILDLGPGVGALVLHAAPEMDGQEIEVSPLGSGAPAHRTHSRVRPRKTGGETQYAAVYPQLAETGLDLAASVQTLGYRIRKIEQLTGRGVSRTEHLAEWWFALRAHDLLDGGQAARERS